MRVVVLFVAVLIIAIGVVGIIAPVAIGLLLILSASTSRTPKSLRGLGVLVCLQGIIQGVGAPFVGIDRARAILEWEAVHTGLLRIGALIALAIGGFVAFTVKPPCPI